MELTRQPDDHQDHTRLVCHCGNTAFSISFRLSEEQQKYEEQRWRRMYTYVEYSPDLQVVICTACGAEGTVTSTDVQPPTHQSYTEYEHYSSYLQRKREEEARQKREEAQFHPFIWRDDNVRTWYGDETE